MVTLKQSRKPYGRLCGAKAPSREEFSVREVSETAHDCDLVITGSFNRLLDRLAKLDYWEAWVAGRRITRAAKKQGVEATIPMSAVCELTGLTTEDMDIFCSAFGFIKIVEIGEDPLLLAPDVFGLLKIFERFVDQGLICKSKWE